MKAGGTAAFVATGDKNAGQGNVTIQGSDVNAKDVLLQATNKVNLVNSTDTDSTRSTNESKSASVGVSYGTGGFGVSASMSRAHGDANSDAATQNNTHVSASNTATIISGGDTNIVGANVNANKVIADVGGNLNLASVQDTSRSEAHQSSSGGGFSVSQGGASASVSMQNGHASGNYAGVNEQAGIRAGDGGFDINVKGNTEPQGKLLGQCPYGKLLQQLEERTGSRHALPDTPGREGRSVRIHRSVLQPQSSSFVARLCFSGAVPSGLDQSSADQGRRCITRNRWKAKNRGKLRGKDYIAEFFDVSSAEWRILDH